MGRDKANLPFRESTLLRAAVNKLTQAGFAVLVSGQYSEEEAAGATCVPDNFRECGPLSGLEAALQYIGSSLAQPVLFVPVDVPLLPRAFLEELWGRASNSFAAATVPVVEGAPQPLCAVYASSLAPGVRRALERGERKVLPVVLGLGKELGGIDTFRVEALAAARGWRGVSGWFRNLNTPGDYQEVLALCAHDRCGELASSRI